MDEAQWAAFFQLMEEVVNIELSWRQKRDLVRQQAREHGSAGALEELLGWFEDSDDE
jgi:hypothetical protein